MARLAGVVWMKRLGQVDSSFCVSWELTLLIRISAFAQQKLDELLAVLDARRDHEWCPADVVL